MSYYLTNENSVLNINNAHLKVSGNIQTDVMKLGAIEFAPPASDVAGTVNFTNVTTGATTSSNLNVGGTLMLGTVEVVSTTHTLENTTTNGNITPHTVEFTNPTTSIVASGNVSVGGELTMTGTGALTVPSGTTEEQPTGVAGMIRFNSTLNRLEVYNGTVWQSIGGVSATSDGTVTSASGYTIHTFTSSGTFTMIAGGDVEYLIVAGGGGGGGNVAGGGGAGGMLTGPLYLNAGSYTITRGGGGAGSSSGSGPGVLGNDGSDSSIAPTVGSALIVAYGGGGGGNGDGSGRDGGSGGGAAASSATAGAAGSGTSGQGNNGGSGTSNAGNYCAGGGGGAGGVGGGGVQGGAPGNGGAGLSSSISGTPVFYAGGGGGASSTSNSISTGGSSIGGIGGRQSPSAAPTTGTTNSGSGGGGGGGVGASGGPGIVIIRYLS